MATQEEINGIFPTMIDNFRADKAEGVNTTIQFELGGDNGGAYWIKIENGSPTYGTGAVQADLTVKATAEDFLNIAAGQTNPMQAFMMGKIKVTDTNLALKMMQWFQLGS